MGGWAELLIALVSFLVFVGGVVLVAMLLALLVRPSRNNPTTDPRPVRETLDNLYASGQITRDEYLERKQVLGLDD